MNSQTLTSRARLEQVEALLRDLMVRDFEHDKAGASSLGRMLVHVVNIHRSVSLPTDDHTNAAKRLGDFALTMERLKVQKPESAIRLTRVAEVLRAARAGLVESAPAGSEPGEPSAEDAIQQGDGDHRKPEQRHYQA